MQNNLKLRIPGWRSLLWSLALVVLGAALGFGLNAVSTTGINLHIALGLDDPAPSPAASAGQAPAAAVKP